MNNICVLFLLLFCSALAHAAPLRVFLIGDKEKASTHFSENAGKYDFTPIARDEIILPKHRTFSPVDIPGALRGDSKKHSATAVLIINDAGKVVDVAITESTHRLIAETVRKNVRRWKFLPAKKEGKAVAFMIQAPFEFETVNPEALIKILEQAEAKGKE